MILNSNLSTFLITTDNLLYDCDVRILSQYLFKGQPLGNKFYFDVWKTQKWKRTFFLPKMPIFVLVFIQFDEFLTHRDLHKLMRGFGVNNHSMTTDANAHIFTFANLETFPFIHTS